MTPPSKTRFEMLLSTKEHEMHHRGQLMLIERMLGIVPHLTRQMQERMAAVTSGPARKFPLLTCQPRVHPMPLRVRFCVQPAGVSPVSSTRNPLAGSWHSTTTVLWDDCNFGLLSGDHFSRR